MVTSLFFLSLSFRLLFFIVARTWEAGMMNSVIVTGDAKEYHNLAVNILEHHRFSLQPDSSPNALRTPMYPAFISVVYAVAGKAPFAVLAAQLFVDSFSCIILFISLASITRRKVAFIASLFYAVDPFLILSSNRLMSESLFIFLCVAALYFIIKAISGDQPLRYTAMLSATSAFLMGLACLTRPILIYLPYAMAIFLCIIFMKKRKRALLIAPLYLATFLVTIAPWCLRNYELFHSYALSTSGGFNLMSLEITPMEMERRHIQNFDSVEIMLIREAEHNMAADGLDTTAINEFQKERYYEQLAVAYIEKYPGNFAQHYALGVIHSLVNLESSGFAGWLKLHFGQEPMDIRGKTQVTELIATFFKTKNVPEIMIAFSIALFLLISYICLIAGLFSCIRSDNKAFTGLFIITALYFVLLAGAGGLARFRVPAIPFYLYFVGTGFSSIYSRFRQNINLQSLIN